MVNKKVIYSVVLCGILALVGLAGAGRLFADAMAIESAPALISYQGYLTDDAGDAYSGTASLQFTIYDADTGGTNLWSETHSGVTVDSGNFALKLGSVTAFPADLFNDPTRYLKVGVDLTDIGSSFSDLPRQQLTSVPYAMTANSVSWSGITGMPSDFADGTDDVGGANYENVVTVAQSGGDYTSISTAMNAITPTASSRYLIRVMPGTYTETVAVKEYVHVRGSGMGVTRLTSDASGNVNDAEAATLEMGANAELSEIYVANTSVTDGAVAVRVNFGDSNTRLSNVKMKVIGAGGDRHIGLYVRSSNGVLVEHSDVEASGGSIFSKAIYNTGSSTTYDSVTATASSGGNGGTARGLDVGGGDLVVVRNSEIVAFDSSQSFAVHSNASGSDLLRIDHSAIDGETTGMHKSNSQTVYIGASLVEGGTFSFGGITRCAQSYTASYVELNTACN